MGHPDVSNQYVAAPSAAAAGRRPAAAAPRSDDMLDLDASVLG